MKRRRSKKYDDASWHSGGNFPKDLPAKAGATHTGMFFAWALLSGLAAEDFPDDLSRLRDRRITPGAFFLACSGKFTDEDLNDEGNAFAAAYFDLQKGKYITDYEATFGKDGPTLYHVADSWENYDRIAPLLDDRFKAWRQHT